MRGHRLLSQLLIRAVRLASLALAATIATFVVLPGAGPFKEPRPALAADSTVGGSLFVATGSNGVDGQLFTGNPSTGASKLVGDIHVNGVPIGITGLAVHPFTRVLFGSTAAGSPNLAGTLVTIDTATGAATVVGPLNPGGTCISGFGTATLNDLAFRADGVLFGFCLSTLFTVNQTTGAASVVGVGTYPGSPPFTGSSLSFRPLLGNSQELWVSAGLATGPIYRVNPADGSVLLVLPLVGGVGLTRLAGLTADADGTLLGVLTDGSISPTTSLLVAVDTVTGVITPRGTLPGDSDAIALDLAEVRAISSEDDDNDGKKTEEQIRNEQRTNKGGRHDVTTEGNVTAVERAADGKSLLVTIALTRDETLVVQVPCQAEQGGFTCREIRVGDYLEADGYQNGVGDPNSYFVADESVTLWRNGQRVR